MDDLRKKRIGDEIRTEIARMILSGEIKDPRINSFVSVTRAEVSRDLGFASVYVSTFEGDEKLERAVEGLNHAAGFVQSLVARKMRLRQTPKILFIADVGIKKGFEMTEKIKDLMTDEGKPKD